MILPEKEKRLSGQQLADEPLKDQVKKPRQIAGATG
jgi:hypothetical protein